MASVFGSPDPPTPCIRNTSRRSVAAGDSSLLDGSDDRLTLFRNQEIDGPRPFRRAGVLDGVNSLIRIRAEGPRPHHVRRTALRFVSSLGLTTSQTRHRQTKEAATDMFYL